MFRAAREYVQHVGSWLRSLGCQPVKYAVACSTAAESLPGGRQNGMARSIGLIPAPTACSQVANEKVVPKQPLAAEQQPRKQAAAGQGRAAAGPVAVLQVPVMPGAVAGTSAAPAAPSARQTAAPIAAGGSPPPVPVAIVHATMPVQQGGTQAVPAQQQAAVDGGAVATEALQPSDVAAALEQAQASGEPLGPEAAQPAQQPLVPLVSDQQLVEVR